jgi:Ribbon-helix-helix protein, copG family
MSKLTLRGLNDKTLDELKRLARAEGISANAFVRRLIEKAVSAQPRAALRRNDDLDVMVGTWCKEDAEKFERVTEPVRTIDPLPSEPDRFDKVRGSADIRWRTNDLMQMLRS